jgi:hypothetical protein
MRCEFVGPFGSVAVYQRRRPTDTYRTGRPDQIFKKKCSASWTWVLVQVCNCATVEWPSWELGSSDRPAILEFAE